MAPRKPKQPAKPTSASEEAVKPKRTRAPKTQATKAPAKRGKAKPKKPTKVRKAAVETVVADVTPSPRAAWDERFISVAETILRMGGTDAQLAMALGCDIEDIAWWREEYPKFDAAFGRYAGMGVRGGRPTEYDAKFVAIARKLGELGATDLEVAQAFEVNIRTIYRWKLDHPEFSEALQSGKDVIDDAIEIALRKRAVGYTFDGEEIKVIDGEVIRVEKMEHVPPDPKAAMFWLQNRRPERWRAVGKINFDVEKGGSLERFLEEISGNSIRPNSKSPEQRDEAEDVDGRPNAIMPKGNG